MLNPPFRPEKMEALRVRVYPALVPLRDKRPLAEQVGPGEERLHVFDCEDGVRVILNRCWAKFDFQAGKQTALHASASFEEESPIDAFINDGDAESTMMVFRLVAWKRVWELLGLGKRPYVEPESCPKSGWPHWLIPFEMTGLEE
jgi:hypothetical protein